MSTQEQCRHRIEAARIAAQDFCDGESRHGGEGSYFIYNGIVNIRAGFSERRQLPMIDFMTVGEFVGGVAIASASETETVTAEEIADVCHEIGHIKAFEEGNA